MGWQDFVKDYLTFSKRDRIGVLVLVTLIIAVFLMPTILPKKNKANTIIDTSWANKMQALIIKDSDSRNNNTYNRYNDDNSNNYQYDRNANTYTGKQKGELFYFDPNTLSFEGWQKLGLRDKTIQTIKNYLSKGGHFKTPDDLKKVYGLFPDEYDRIAPYIQITASNATIDNANNTTTAQTDTRQAKSNTPKYNIVHINTADTTAFIALPGIGSKLAARIINFRDKLGGFYSINQVAETYGLPDSTFQKIKQYLSVDENSIQKININSATAELLKAHPYIRWELAKPIINYRTEHGLFTKIEDLKKIMVITDEAYRKLEPYLTLQ